VRRSRAGAARNSCPAGLRCRTGGDARIRGNEKPVVPVSLAAPFRPTQQRAGAPSGAPGLLLCQEAGVSPCAPGRRPFRSSALGWPDARNHAPKAAVTTSERRDPESNWDTTIFRRGSSAVETSRKACIYTGSGRRSWPRQVRKLRSFFADLGTRIEFSTQMDAARARELAGRRWLISSDVGRGMHCGPQAWGFAGSVVRRASARARCGSGARSAPGAPSAVPCLACPLAVDHVDDSPVLPSARPWLAYGRARRLAPASCRAWPGRPRGRRRQRVAHRPCSRRGRGIRSRGQAG
jgi:hypothetical protein